MRMDFWGYLPLGADEWALSRTTPGVGIAQGRISVSQLLCEIFVLNLVGVLKDLHGYALGCAFAHLGTLPVQCLRCALRCALWVIIPEYKRNSAAYIHRFSTYCLPPTHHYPVYCYIFLFGPLPFTNDALDCVPNAVWAHKMVVVK